ncbi:MAG TPA: carbon monoxide dehydrogenase subunit G, partial [Thermohalobaculum sp.]|nr:carbon monoxide dehydrogenase subunit G [Thermohalobaculum sp.]
MKLEGERIIEASRAAVWEALNDADVLRACIPGCEELERTSDTTFEGQVLQKVGPVKARFRGAVTLGNVVEAESYTITGEGKGGAAGFVKGGADVSLSDGEDGSTRLAFDAEAQVGGKLAQMGNRVVQGYARKVADQFFDRFKEEVERPASEDSVTPGVDQAPDELVAADASPSVVADETEDATLSDHPLEKPGSARPPTREEPISGAAAAPEGEPVEEPEATSAGAGPAGGVEAPDQAAISKTAADRAAAEESDE